VFLSDRSTVRLNPARAQTDAREFEAELRQAGECGTGEDRKQNLSRALGLYRGPLLASRTETWVLGERERLASLYSHGTLQLSECLVLSGDLAAALQAVQQGVNHNPLDEELHREIIKLYRMMDRPSAARRQYQALERLLRDEMGAVPSSSTRDLLDAPLRLAFSSSGHHQELNGTASPSVQIADRLEMNEREHPASSSAALQCSEAETPQMARDDGMVPPGQDRRVIDRRVVLGALGAVGLGTAIRALSSLHAHLDPDPSEAKAALGEWSTRSPMPAARRDMAAVTLGEEIYLLGGSSDGVPLPDVWIYNTRNNTWDTSAPAMLSPRANHAAVAGSDGKIYVMGGHDGHSAVSAMEVYDAKTRKWSYLPSMKTRRYMHAAVCDNDGMIYAIGGMEQPTQKPCDKMELYWNYSNQWTDRAPMKTHRWDFAAALGQDGWIYALGGLGGGGIPLNTVEAYHPVHNIWKQIRPLPRPWHEGIALAMEGKILLVGGKVDGGPPSNLVQSFDLLSQTWTLLKPMPTARSLIGVAVGVDQRIYVFGGHNGVRMTRSVEVFTPPSRWAETA
jgi:DNA-binding SARP family transcriptional activator